MSDEKSIVKEVEDTCDELKEELYELNKQLLMFQADVILRMPISLSYEDWCFLHRVVEGNFEITQ